MTTVSGRPDSVNKDFRRKDRPIQNFPDYLRYVAERSKAGFDKVHDELYKIFDDTSEKKVKRPDSNTLIDATRPRLRDRLSGSFKKNFRWTIGGSLPKQESFLSYISEEDGSDENENKITESMSASIVEKSSTVFNFDEDELVVPEKNIKMKPPIKARYSVQAKSNVMDRCADIDNKYQSLNVNQMKTVNAPLPCASNQYLQMDGGYTKLSANPCIEGDYARLVKDRDDKSDDEIDANFDYQNLPNALTEKDSFLTNGPPKKPSPINKDIVRIRPVPSKRQTFASQSERTYDVPPVHIGSFLPEGGSAKKSNVSIKTPKITRSQTHAGDHSNTEYHQRVALTSFKEDSQQTFYGTFPDGKDASDAIYDIPSAEIRPVDNSDNDDEQVFYQNVKEVKILREVFYNNDAEQNSSLEDKTEFFQYNAYEVAFYLNKFGFATLAKVCQEFEFDGTHFQTLTTDDLRKAPYSLKPAQVKRFVKLISGSTPHSAICIEKNDEDDNYDVPPGEKQFLVELKNHTSTDENPSSVVKNRNIANKRTESCLEDNDDLYINFEADDLYINWEAIHLTKPNDPQYTNEAFFSMSVNDVIAYLNENGLRKMAEVCKENGLDGKYFINITEDALKKAPFCMNWFYISRFFKLLKRQELQPL